VAADDDGFIRVKPDEIIFLWKQSNRITLSVVPAKAGTQNP